MLDDYEPVAVRLDRWFKTETEAGFIPRILTTLLSAPGADVCVFRAELWRITQLADGAGERSTLLASGHAEEVRGSNHITKTSHLEVCETSALGRALSNWNQISHATVNGRPSREEMEKVERYAGPSQSSSNGHANTVVRGPMTGAASEKQIGYIMGACKRDGIVPPAWVKNLSKQDASSFIEAHKNGESVSAILERLGSTEEPF
jgi:hypothetical protein